MVKNRFKNQVKNSKSYSGADIGSDNNLVMMKCDDRCYFGLVPVFKSKILSWKSKITLYKVLVRPVALYACSVWAMTKSDELKFAISERKILRRIYGPQKKTTQVNMRRGQTRRLKTYEYMEKQPSIVS